MDVTDEAIEEALRLVGWETTPGLIRADERFDAERSILAHARTIMEFQAFRQEVSDAVLYCFGQGTSGFHKETLERFIIAKPDPDEELAREVATQMGTPENSDYWLDARDTALATIKRLREQGRLTDAK